jgi:hypothetical protein
MFDVKTPVSLHICRTSTWDTRATTLESTFCRISRSVRYGTVQFRYDSKRIFQLYAVFSKNGTPPLTGTFAHNGKISITGLVASTFHTLKQQGQQIIMSGTKYMPTKSGFEDEFGGATISLKQGHKCCGCCCDTRRAVIIVDSIVTVSTLLSTVLVGTGVKLMEAYAADADDDQVVEAGKQLQGIPVGLLVVFMLLRAALCVLGVLGAISYKKWMVVAALCTHVLSVVIYLLHFNVPYMVFAGLLAYPHVFFIKEMDANVMTPDNYPNEVQSCCCV